MSQIKIETQPHLTKARIGLFRLPKPKNPAIKIIVIEGKRFAAIRFSGLASGDSLKRHTDELMEFIRAKTLAAASAPAYPFYNPPWTLTSCVAMKS